ncbi:MAG: hypothetical protein ACRC8S_09310 [Fimbriiglobus sp.]
MLRIVWLAVALWVGLSSAWAVDSGPKAGEAVAELDVFAVIGTIENKQVNYTKERAEKPTVYLFVQADKFSRPMSRFLRELDSKIAETADKAESVATWVGGDFEKNKEYLPKANMSLKFSNSALCAFKGDEPKGWALNSDAHLTAVVVVKGKVVKSFAYVSVNDTDVKAVLEELKKATK